MSNKLVMHRSHHLYIVLVVISLSLRVLTLQSSALALSSSNPMTTMTSWIARPSSSRLSIARRKLSRPRTTGPILLPYQHCLCPSSSSTSRRCAFSSNSHDIIETDHQHELLESKLRQLALLNGGKSINPRSPRQVSNLLYGNDSLSFQSPTSGRSSRATAAVPLGPTDKATLQQMILRDDNNDDTNEGESERIKEQRQAAKLILQCRELLASKNNIKNSHNGSRRVGSSSSSTQSESFASKATRGMINTGSFSSQFMQKSKQVANFSNVVGSQEQHQTLEDSNTGNDIINSLEVESRRDEIARNVSLTSPYTPATYSMLSPYERMVMDLFPNIDSGSNNDDYNDSDRNQEDTMSLDPYWTEPLLSVTKSSARSLVRQLQSTNCPMGYDPSASPLNTIISNSNNSNSSISPKRTTSLLSYIRTQKSTYFSDAVVLVRVGDFYESYGLDAVMLVEHCGLNPMAGKARAGCPWRNVQATLDGLTGAGFRVAVYEEWNGVDEELLGEQTYEESTADGDSKKKKSSKPKLKTRYLAQVVSSANPTYMHGLVLNDDNGGATDDTPAPHGDLSSSSPGRSYVGVIETNAGYTLVEISAEERTAVVSERLTAEAVSCRLVAYPPADPLFYVPPYTETDGSGSKRRLDRLPFLPWRQHHHPLATSAASLASNRFSQVGIGKVRVKTLPPSLVVAPQPGLTDVERAKQTVVSAFLRLEDDRNESSSNEDSSSSSPLKKQQRRVVTHHDFTIIASSLGSDSNVDSYTTTHPLHLETATQLGLMSDPAIPPLIPSLLPDSAPTSSRRFLRRWLLIPPPPEIADAMSKLVRALKDGEGGALPLPSLNAPSLTGKVVSLIRAGQASAAVYREIVVALDAASEVLLLDDGIGDHGKVPDVDSCAGIVDPLIKILQHDTGITIHDEGSNNNSMKLRESFLDAMKIIGTIVNTQNLEHSLHNTCSADDGEPEQLDSISYYGDVVPPAFFERNEAIWRGRVKPVALEHATTVPVAARRLAEAIAVDFWGVDKDAITYDQDGIIDLSEAKESKSPVVQDIFNNLIAIKSIPSWGKKGVSSDESTAESSTSDKRDRYYFHPRDRNGKVLQTRYTSERVQEALSDYIEACADARAEVEKVLTRLSWDLVDNGHLPAVMRASHLNLILSTAAQHAGSSNAKGWSVGTVYNNDDNSADNTESISTPPSAGHFSGVWPYWMDRSESVPNTFDLDGLFLLTAPNMSGKSTLMRSTAAAALLINCGLCAPVGPGSALRRFDSVFVRGASADVPTEDKSAFGAEMGDVAALLRSCGDRSLVFVDEIGRGTSPRDGTGLAGAVLEGMAGAGMSGMFATHLHGVLDLPYSEIAEERLRKKRMAITEDKKWTYKLEDGVCTNSLALLTAAKFGLPDSIIKRAEELSEYCHADTKGNTKEPTLDLAFTRSSSRNNNIHHATTILEEVVGKDSNIVQIPPSYMSPPSLEGKSCVYILQIGDNEDSMRYYIGETDSLSKRLSQHRSKGKKWATVNAIAIEINEGKTHARNVESLVIRKMAKSGFDLVSIQDGLRKN